MFRDALRPGRASRGRELEALVALLLRLPMSVKREQFVVAEESPYLLLDGQF